MMIEWSGQQQLLFLLKSIPVGAIIGFVFSVINANSRERKFSWRWFTVDIICSVLFALITFFASLVIMDGHLHPILFVGMVIGFLGVHFLCGRYIVYVIRALRSACGLVLNFVKHRLWKLPFKRADAENQQVEGSGIS